MNELRGASLPGAEIGPSVWASATHLDAPGDSDSDSNGNFEDESPTRLLDALGYVGPLPRVDTQARGTNVRLTVHFPDAFRDLLRDDAGRDAALTYVNAMLDSSFDDAGAPLPAHRAIIETLLQLEAFKHEVKPYALDDRSMRRFAALVPPRFDRQIGSARFGNGPQRESIHEQIRQALRERGRSWSAATVERSLDAWLLCHRCSPTPRHAANSLDISDSFAQALLSRTSEVREVAETLLYTVFEERLGLPLEQIDSALVTLRAGLGGWAS